MPETCNIISATFHQVQKFCDRRGRKYIPQIRTYSDNKEFSLVYFVNIYFVIEKKIVTVNLKETVYAEIQIII